MGAGELPNSVVICLTLFVTVRLLYIQLKKTFRLVLVLSGTNHYHLPSARKLRVLVN